MLWTTSRLRMLATYIIYLYLHYSSAVDREEHARFEIFEKHHERSWSRGRQWTLTHSFQVQNTTRLISRFRFWLVTRRLVFVTTSLPSAVEHNATGEGKKSILIENAFRFYRVIIKIIIIIKPWNTSRVVSIGYPTPGGYLKVILGRSRVRPSVKSS